MPEFQLIDRTPLDGATEMIGATTLSELVVEIVSVATPLGGADVLSAKLDAAYGLTLPAAGKSVQSGDHALTLLWTAPDQCLLVTAGRNVRFDTEVEQTLEGAGHVTLQSDNWVAVEVGGPDCRDVLSRFAMFDLHPDVFAIADTARGLMKHLNVILTRTGEDRYLLLSASSSAQDFWHGLTQAARAHTGLGALRHCGDRPQR